MVLSNSGRQSNCGKICFAVLITIDTETAIPCSRYSKMNHRRSSLHASKQEQRPRQTFLFCVISSICLIHCKCIKGCTFTSLHALCRVISSLSISRCTWRIIAILSFVENRLLFASNDGALSASPLVGAVFGVGCAGGPSLSKVIWPADCTKNEVETKYRYVQLLGHLDCPNYTRACLSVCVWYQVCQVSPPFALEYMCPVLSRRLLENYAFVFPVLLIFAENSKGILYIPDHRKLRKISIG